MSVKSFDKGCLDAAVAALPGLVVAVVLVHVVHQPPEPLALLLTQLADGKLLVVLCYLHLGVITQRSLLLQLIQRNDFPRSTTLSLDRYLSVTIDDLHVFTVAAAIAPPPCVLYPRRLS